VSVHRFFGVLTSAALVVLALSACGDDKKKSGSALCPEDNPDCREAATETAGETAVGRRKCAGCHDSSAGKLAGQTSPLAGQVEGVELYPPNLTPDKTGIGDWTDDQLATAIRSGFDRHSLALCPQMKHDATMSDFEVYSIVKYLRTVTPVKNVIPRSVCPPLKTKEEQPLGR
jgi:hypothetical protein